MSWSMGGKTPYHKEYQIAADHISEIQPWIAIIHRKTDV